MSHRHLRLNTWKSRTKQLHATTVLASLVISNRTMVKQPCMAKRVLPVNQLQIANMATQEPREVDKATRLQCRWAQVALRPIMLVLKIMDGVRSLRKSQQKTPCSCWPGYMASRESVPVQLCFLSFSFLFHVKSLSGSVPSLGSKNFEFGS